MLKITGWLRMIIRLFYISSKKWMSNICVPSVIIIPLHALLSSNGETSSPRRVKGYGFRTPKSLIIFMVSHSEDKDDRFSLTLTSWQQRGGREGIKERQKRERAVNWDGKPKANTCTQTLSIERWVFSWTLGKCGVCVILSVLCRSIGYGKLWALPKYFYRHHWRQKD